MRIVLFSHNSKLEGAPLHLVRLAKHFEQDGHTCTALTPEEGPINTIWKEQGTPVYVVPTLYTENMPSKALGNIPALQEADICIVNTLVGYPLLTLLKQHFSHIKLVWMIHEAEYTFYQREYPRLSAAHFSLPDCVLFPAHAVQHAYKHLPIRKALTIHNGLDIQEINAHIADNDPTVLRQRYGIPQHAIVITMMGYISERKAQLEFIEAAIKLEKEFGPKVHFVIVGHYTEWHTAYKDFCIQRILQANIEDRVSFFSPTDDPYQFYCLSDITVCPSYVEALPYVILEAMACGKPVVASAVYGIPEIIQDKKNGLLIIPGHIQEMTEALRSLIVNSNMRDAMGKAARERIAEAFDATHMYRQYRALCTELCTQPHITRTQRLLRLMYRCWLRCGAPAPRLARFIRYRILRPIWPVTTQPKKATSAPAAGPLPNTSVSIIIPSHNYGMYLRDAILSALHQTVQPKEIIVVDDASSDNTALIAAEFANQGVQYIRGNWHNVGKARNTAMKLTTGEFLMFLDADDMLHPQYAACGAEVLLNNPSVGLAYADSQFFGKNNTMRTQLPDTYDWQLFDRQNHIFAVSMVRRTALMQVGGWAETDHQHLDWITWRRILQLGWKAQKSKGLHLYRQHSNNMFHSYRQKYPFAYRSGLCTEPTTLCLSLSGRTWMWPLTQQFLEAQTLNHNQVHLCILDTSGNVEFGEQVQTWLAQCDYAGYTYKTQHVGRKGLADLPRTDARQEVRDACATIYNTFARLCTTATACFLEDDILPPPNAYERLLEQFTPESVSVSGYYCHRGTTRPVAWNYDAHHYPCDADVQTETTTVGGTGFGCLAMRGEYLRNTVFSSGMPLKNYDHNFFRTVSQHAYHTALIDWSLRCKHFSSPDTWS